MTRKDFQFIADVIKNLPGHSPILRTQKRSCALAFADALPNVNARFNRERFLAACGEREAPPV
jgi:hypothetical protein